MICNFIIALAFIVALILIYDIIRMRAVIHIVVIENWMCYIAKIDMLR